MVYVYSICSSSSVFVFILILVFMFFFFKQKTAYEMRISDWSSDVCSSDLRPPDGSDAGRIGPARASHGRCAPLTTSSEPRYGPSELLVVETKNRRFRRRVIHPPAPAYFPAGEFSHDQDPLRTSAAAECGVG